MATTCFGKTMPSSGSDYVPFLTQKGTQSLPEDGIVLPKHVVAIVKENNEFQCI
jgi:hypothetical protein